MTVEQWLKKTKKVYSICPAVHVRAYLQQALEIIETQHNALYTSKHSYCDQCGRSEVAKQIRDAVNMEIPDDS